MYVLVWDSFNTTRYWWYRLNYFHQNCFSFPGFSSTGWKAANSVRERQTSCQGWYSAWGNGCADWDRSAWCVYNRWWPGRSWFESDRGQCSNRTATRSSDQIAQRNIPFRNRWVVFYCLLIRLVKWSVMIESVYGWMNVCSNKFLLSFCSFFTCLWKTEGKGYTMLHLCWHEKLAQVTECSVVHLSWCLVQCSPQTRARLWRKSCILLGYG